MLQALRWSTSAPSTNVCTGDHPNGFCCLRCFRQKTILKVCGDTKTEQNSIDNLFEIEVTFSRLGFIFYCKYHWETDCIFKMFAAKCMHLGIWGHPTLFWETCPCASHLHFHQSQWLLQPKSPGAQDKPERTASQIPLCQPSNTEIPH